jgi:hypothetical protein
VGNDVSDGSFLVSPVRITEPAAGQTLSGGNSVSVAWDASPVILPASVIVSWTDPTTTGWRRIYSSPGNPGSCTWAVPAVSRSGVKVRVQFYNSSGAVMAQDVLTGLTISTAP